MRVVKGQPKVRTGAAKLREHDAAMRSVERYANSVTYLVEATIAFGVDLLLEIDPVGSTHLREHLVNGRIQQFSSSAV
jgi:hypothetical protein